MDFYLHAFGFGGKGIRTPDLLIANETLYQLSYTPKYLIIKVLSSIQERAIFIETPVCHPVALNHFKRKSARQLLNKVQSAQWLFRHSINGTYYAQKKINGKRKEHSLDTTDRKIAE